MTSSNGTDRTGVEAFNAYFKAHPVSVPMSNDEIDLHKRNALRMGQEGQSLAAIASYLKVAGVPMKREVNFAPGTDAHLGGLLMSALHGATFGWDDEAIGSLYGIVTGGTAQAGRDVYRARLKQFHDQNAVSDVLAQLAGGVLTGSTAARVTKAGIGMVAPKAVEYLTSMPGVAKALVGGAAGGAAFAAGDAQGGVAPRLGAAPGGAALGGAAGGVLYGAGRIVGQIIKPIARNVPGLSKLYQSVEHQADDIVLHDIEKDGTTPALMLQKARAMQAQGVTPTIADLAGENTRNRLAAPQAASGEGMQRIKQGFQQRQAGAGDRIADWINGKAKLSLQNIEQVRNGLLGARSADADILYREAYAQSAPMTDRLKELFRNAKFRDAWNEARIELRSQPGGQDIGPLTKPFFPGGGAFQKPGVQGAAEEILPTELSVAGLDYTKRYLDQVIRSAAAQGQSGWKRGVAHGLAQNLENALQEVDQLVPVYGKARQTYHSDSRVIDALDAGRGFLKMSAAKIEVAMQGHSSTAETEAFRLGAIEDMKDAIYGLRAKYPDVAQSVFGAPETKRKLSLLFGKEAPEMLDRLRTEARFGETYARTTGSRTAPLLNMMVDNEAQASGVIGNLIANQPGRAIVGISRLGGARMRLTHGEKVANALSNAYTKGLEDPAELTGYLLNLMSRQPRASMAPEIGAAIGAQAVAEPYAP